MTLEELVRLVGLARKDGWIVVRTIVGTFGRGLIIGDPNSETAHVIYDPLDYITLTPPLQEAST